MDRRLARRLVALAAAYAVALNTLLPVLTALALPGAGGVIRLEVICSADPGAPAKPQPPGPCCLRPAGLRRNRPAGRRFERRRRPAPARAAGRARRRCLAEPDVLARRLQAGPGAPARLMGRRPQLGIKQINSGCATRLFGNGATP